MKKSQEMFSEKLTKLAVPCKTRMEGRLGKRNKSKFKWEEKKWEGGRQHIVWFVNWVLFWNQDLNKEENDTFLGELNISTIFVKHQQVLHIVLIYASIGKNRNKTILWALQYSG